MRLHILSAALLALGFTTLEASANPIAPKSPPPPRENPVVMGARAAELVVEIEEGLKEARLQIPSKLLGARPRLGADAGRVPTLIAGLALAGAFVSGGFWLVRRGRGRTLAAGLLVLSLVTIGGSGVLANKAVPPEPRTVPVTLPAEVQLQGNIVLEIVPNGDKIKLQVPKSMIKNTADNLKKD